MCVYFMSSLNMCTYLFGGEITGHGINSGGLAKVVPLCLVFGHDTFERTLSQHFYWTPHTPKLPSWDKSLTKKVIVQLRSENFKSSTLVNHWEIFRSWHCPSHKGLTVLIFCSSQGTEDPSNKMLVWAEFGS